MNTGTPVEVAAILPPALSVEHVSHRYGARKALHDVTFSIEPATFAVLLGLNGAGKSTLIAVATGLFASQSGTVCVFGHDMAAESGSALGELGVVFQSRTLDLDLTVEQNMAYQGALHGIGRGRSLARARELVDRVGLADRLNDRVRHLSGGQFRRVEIARALVHSPSLILMDEPTAGLDIRSRADILSLSRRLVAQDRVAVLWATHLVDEIRSDDQVLALHEGRLLASDSASAVSAAAGVDSIGAAFAKLTGGAGEDGS